MTEDDWINKRDEWGYDKQRNVEYITHDSGTAQFEISQDGMNGPYNIQFQFEGGTDFAEIRAHDTEQVDTREDAKTAVMEIIARFEEEIDDRYYTQDPDDIELHRIGGEE